MSNERARIDYKRELRELYAPPRDTPVVVDVPELSFLMVDGRGDPNTATAYREAIVALFAVSYTVRFAIKRMPGGFEYGVMPLEGLWWVEGMAAFPLEDKSRWSWTAMIMQPELVSEELVREAIAAATAKKQLPAAGELRLERFREGTTAQVLHVGPYSAEQPTIERLHAFITEQGYERAGKHHEIYLGDPRRTAPERLRTVLRQPIRRAA